MPVDRHPPRRASAEDPAVRQREQELRRARGEIACVECQRLKLKCDRKVPCSSCIRRNRAAMCPNGHAWSDQETRSLLSDTAQLHRKLSEMSQRIRQLEDALEISHSASSSNSHPLLREELLAIKRGVGPIPAAMAPVADENDRETLGTGDDDGTADIEEAMGIMSISSRGFSRFIGRSGGSETLFLLGTKIAPPVTGRPEIDSLFTQNLGRSNDAWLLMPPNAKKEEVLCTINSNMPSFERAYSLAETYLENFSWVLRIVQRDQLFNELLPTQYKRLRHAGEDPNSVNMTAHELALLLAVFAAGSLADLTLPPFNDEAERYYQMALAALSVTPVLGGGTLAAVQALSILGAYNAHSGRTFSLDLSGAFFSLAAHLGISMGLHRDCEKWKVKSNIVERRRFVFWELFTADCWHNIANGKPGSFSLQYCDCKFPLDIEKRTLPNGQLEHSYWVFRHTFIRDLVYPINDLFSGLKPIKYHQILEQDRKISEFAIPQHLLIPPGGSSMETDGPLLIMERMIPPVCRDGLLMYIHRGYFAKALLDHPKDPLRSSYAHSYLSAYRAALSMLKVIREHYNLFPNLVSRFWSLWSHAFSATVIIGSIVIRGRNSETAKAALAELNLAVTLFEKAAQHADRAKRSLPTLLRLREKAVEAAKQLDDVGTLETENKRIVVEGYDELMIFGGSTKLFDKDKIKKDHPGMLKRHPDEVPPMSATNHSGSTSASASAVASMMQSLPSQPSADSSLFPPRQQMANMPSTSGSTASSSMATSPPTPEDANLNGTSFPQTWSGWTDQEALLINYLSSGVDMNSAATAAFATDADPMSFLWNDANSPPDSQGSHTGSSSGDSQAQAQGEGIIAQQQQQQQQPRQGVPSSANMDANAFNVFTMGSNFAPPQQMKTAFEAEFGNPVFQQQQPPQPPQPNQQSTSGWEGLLWGGNAYF